MTSSVEVEAVRAAGAEYAARSTAEQGKPLIVDDPVVHRRIAAAVAPLVRAAAQECAA